VSIGLLLLNGIVLFFDIAFPLAYAWSFWILSKDY